MKKYLLLILFFPMISWAIGSSKTEFRIDSIVPNLTGGNITIVTGGNVGINTVSPTATLEVNGIVSGTSFVGDGSALTNTPGQTQWNTVGSDIHYSSGSVAIGKTVPSTTLDVSGTVNAAHVTAITVSAGFFAGDGSGLINLPSSGAGAYDSSVGAGGDFADLSALNSGGTPGNSVFVATETVSASVSFSNAFGIFAGGSSSKSTGTIIIGTGSDGLVIDGLTIDGNLFIELGVKNVRLLNCSHTTGFNTFDESGNRSNLAECLVEE